MKNQTFDHLVVEKIFQSYPPKIRKRLLSLRQIIFETAEQLDVGELEETLKWGQPSYLTKSKSGTTIRIDQLQSYENCYAIFFHCQTSIIERIKQNFTDQFTYEGNRAIIFNLQDEIPVDSIKYCIEMGLRYHLDKKYIMCIS